MVLYQSSVSDFRSAVENNQIVDDIEIEFLRKLGHTVSHSEKQSWNHSLRFMETVLRKANIPDNCGVMIEYNIPATSKRIDFLLAGEDASGHGNFIIIELKQWSDVKSTDKEYLVKVNYGHGEREVPHPSYQAYSYKQYLKDMNEALDSNKLHPYSCSYLHNQKKRHPEPLLETQYQNVYEDTPIFFSDEVSSFERYLHILVGNGNGMHILSEIEQGRIRPSKKLVDYIYDLFQGNKVYTLLDEQKVAYENIIRYALRATKKTTILVNGGPGTGKSIVAVNALVYLLKHDKNIKFVAPNAAFKEAIISGLDKDRNLRTKNIFSGSGSFCTTQMNEYDVLIVDEAHRLKAKGTYMYSGEGQVEDIIRSSLVNVFFIDDEQRIRPNDEGSITKITEMADKYQSSVVQVKLETQFRCSGADGFMKWIDHTLQIQDIAVDEGWDQEAFDFKLFDNPCDLAEEIEILNKSGNTARLLAGYAWPWTSEKEGNKDAEANDVDMPEFGFKMPWNSRRNSTTWAIDSNAWQQIGCIHTSQGLEFDYVGVIIGNDLHYNCQSQLLEASAKNYFDKQGKIGLKNNPEKLTQLIKNIYRVLLSRGMKGCYVFCRDRDTQEYFRSCLAQEKMK